MTKNTLETFKMTKICWVWVSLEMEELEVAGRSVIAVAIEYFHFSGGRGFHGKMIWIVGQMHFGGGQVLGFLWI
jgi:hypothetical protein